MGHGGFGWALGCRGGCDRTRPGARGRAGRPAGLTRHPVRAAAIRGAAVPAAAAAGRLGRRPGLHQAGDGAGLARLGLIVVTFNYRLGSLGFLDLDEIPDSGRAGFLDQVAALRWVHANIAAFGGDPGRVTVYGVSAGAKSGANLLASPLTAGLISRAISSSGGGEHVAGPDQAARVRHRLDEGATYQLMDPPAAGQAAGVLTELFGADEAAPMLAAYPEARPELDDTGIGVAVLSAERYGVPTPGPGCAWRWRIRGPGSVAARRSVTPRATARAAAGLATPAVPATVRAVRAAARPGRVRACRHGDSSTRRTS
jgi:hypothetical protein